MNVYAMKRQIAGILDYDPEEPRYERIVLEVLNRHYLALMARSPWTFAQRRADLVVDKDYTTGTVTVTLGSYTVTGAATVWDSTMDGVAFLGPDTRWYRVSRVVSGTSLILTETYKGPTLAGQTYTIRWRTIRLPTDFVDFEGITARGSDQRRIEFIPPAAEEQIPLTENDGAGSVRWFTDADSWTPRAPDLPLTAVAAVGAGTLLTETAYRYCYTWIIGGVETSPSPVVEVETNATQTQITLATFREVGAALPRQARVYQAEGEGPFYALTDTFAAGLLDDGSVTPDRDKPLRWEGTYRYVRFWPRSDSKETVELRHHHRGHPLMGDADAPELPMEYHKVLVDLALSDLCGKQGDSYRASFYNKRADEGITDMQRRYLSHDLHVPVRQVWTGLGGRLFNVGPITRV